MKSSVLQRKLFMKPPVKKAEGGILSLVEDGEEETEDNYQDRTPDNIEIIANNLRGDMRSMDERYMELAQMVGESAFETPPEVLALMQPQLAQQMQQAQQPAAPTARPAGMEQIASSTPPAPPQGQMQRPGMPAPQPQQPGGIEALVAEAPQQAPVQRSEGSPPTAEVSRSRIQEIIPETELLAMGDLGADDDIDAALQSYFDAGGSMEQLAEVASKPLSIEITGVGDAGLPGSNEDEGVAIVTDMNFDRNLPFKKKDAGGIGSLLAKKSGSFSPDISKFMGKDAANSNAETAAAYANMMRFASPVKRQAGSPPFGERADPRFNTADYFVDPDGTVRPRSGAPTYPSDDIYRSGENMARSRPLTDDELRQRIADREARTMTKGQRAIKGISNFFGQGLKVDPEVVETRLRSFLKGASKVPGVGKVAKYADILLPAGALGLGAAMMDDPKPEVGDGVVPTLPNLPDGSPSLANKIPPVAGSPLLGTPNRESDAVDAVALGRDEVPRQELRRDDSPAPKVVDVDLINPFDPDAPNAYTGENVPPGDAIEDTEAAPTPSAADVTKRPGESDDDFRTRVLARANLYKELLGQDPQSQKTQAYLLLAEAGLALAGATGRNQGERISKGLKGLPSGLAKIASEKTQLDRTATAAAISAVEQEDRDLMKYATQLRLRQAAIDKESLPRMRKIQQHFALFKAQDPNMTDEQATILATGMVDGIYKGDKFGNVLGPTNEILNRGPAMQPTKPGQVGYIADDNPFVVVGKETMPAVVTEEEIGKARKERGDKARMLAGIQTAIPLAEKTYGIGNVLTRAVTVGVTPFVGDVGPFSADKLQSSNAIRLLQRELRELLAVNESRVSVYEQQQIDGLLSDPDSILATPEQFIGQLQNLVRSLTNRINQIDNSLNPNTPLKQLKEVPLGTKNDPVPAYATRALGSFFEARPNGVVYVQRQDGKVFGFTKEQWEKAQGQQ